MPEFLELLPPDQALQEVLQRLAPTLQEEALPVLDALDRVTSRPILAPYPLPTFPRSTVDGFALRAQDTFGTSDSLPAYLRQVVEIPMGAASDYILTQGTCALIHTGGMLPEGADAVVMVEHTQRLRGDEIEILRTAAPGENVLTRGEDVAEGERVITAGVRLRSAEIGGLAALGMMEVWVVHQPRVGLISSGDEVIPLEQEMQLGQVRDVNSYTLAALVQGAGGIPVRYGIVPDQAAALRETAARALYECDLVVITAGSSASSRDLTAQVIGSLGRPGVLVHGVNVRPGKPTILGVCDGVPVIGLPGNPVSALVIARLFVTPVLEALLGVTRKIPPSMLQARLSLNLASQAGREDWVPVRLRIDPDGLLAEPVFGKSNLIFTLVRADGLIRIPPAATGLSAGEIVEVFPL
jgi:molybdopterin molybdotransferase